MKLIWKILRTILTIIGGLALILAAIIYYQSRFKKEPVEIYINPSNKVQASVYLDSLKASGPYCADTIRFNMTSVKDFARAREIMDYFQLDTLS